MVNIFCMTFISIRTLGCAARFAIAIKFEFFDVFAMPQNCITLYLSAGGYKSVIALKLFGSGSNPSLEIKCPINGNINRNFVGLNSIFCGFELRFFYRELIINARTFI